MTPKRTRMLKNFKLWIVDDDPNDIKKLKVGIKKRFSNITTTEFSNGEEFIESVKSNQYLFDLIILDYGLPKMDGSDVLKELKNLGFKKVAVGLTQFDDRLIEMEEACALAAFSKSDKPAFFDFLEGYLKNR